MSKKEIDKLLSLCAPATGFALKADVQVFRNCAGSKGEELHYMLSKMNGGYGFEGALHFFSADEACKDLSIERWNSNDLWRSDYKELDPLGYFFAEDVFGNQFFIKNERISTFDPETGETEEIADSLSDWASEIVGDYDFYTGHSLAHEWQEVHGPIPQGSRLLPKIPFVTGGEYEVENLYALDSVKAMKYRASIALQIKDMSDGSKINIKIDWLDLMV